MTVEGLISRLTQYVSYLYYGREWAGWELLTVPMIALVLLLLIVRRQRKAKTRRIVAKKTEEHSPAIGTNLGLGKGTHKEIADSKSHRSASVSKNNGKQKRWKETTKKWKNFKRLIEELQHEITKYKQAEECFKEQLAKLKAANERLQQELTESKKAAQHPEMGSPRIVGSFGKQKIRMLDDRQVLAEDS
jgi:predicted  nucleic acid-binding Zn-ribbon protein